MVPAALRIAALALLLQACSRPGEPLRLYNTVPVREAVAVKAEPPAELMRDYRGVPLPTWYRPTDPAAQACTSAEGMGALLGIISDLLNRDAAWRAWAATPLPVDAAR